MKCAKAQELFSGYLENAIEAPTRVTLEQHLTECPQCKAAYDRYHATAVMLDELPEVETPPNLHAAVMARVEQARRAAPRPVTWWQVDWQSVFNAKVPVRAVAMGFALLLLLAVVVQLTPLRSITAGFFWQPPSTEIPLGEPIDAPKGPLPPGVKQRTQADYHGAESGMSISVTADTRAEHYTVFFLRLRTETGAATPLEAYILPDGVTAADQGAVEAATKIYSGTVPSGWDTVLPVVVTPSTSRERSLVVQVIWEYKDRRRSEYVFMPPEFDPTASDKSVNLSCREASIYDVLNGIATKYGIVIMASGNLREQVPAVNLGYESPDGALRRVLLRTSLQSRALASSVYRVEGRR